MGGQMSLIILYGCVESVKSPKIQKLIDGKLTCGYREYAKRYGSIVYLSPQDTRLSWEHSMTADESVEFCNQHPDAIVWSVKWDVCKNIKILSKVRNFKMHYPCCALNAINSFCDVNLVDTIDRKVDDTCQVFFKGKDDGFWKPDNSAKDFDYVVMGKPVHGKNHKSVIDSLSKKRKILWIGGKSGDVRNIPSNVHATSLVGPEKVRDWICRACVGILFTEIKTEGFPQSFIEMTMCGVPVVYNKSMPYNPVYYHKENSSPSDLRHLSDVAEKMLHNYDYKKCRNIAVNYYSLDKSFARIEEIRLTR
jgi:hypothetical protein